MTRSVVTPLLMVLAMTALTSSAPAAPVAPAQRFETAYAELLRTYWRPSVTIHGISTTVFDYAQMAEDHARPSSPFARAAQSLVLVDPARLSGDSEKAFWINAYNYGAMRLVVDHYPVDSIRSFKISLIKYPWSKDAVEINGKTYTLNQIEKEILLPKFGDVRILFAVSCAAVSCPDRTAAPFTAAGVDEQLDAMVRTFLANPQKGMHADWDNKTVTLAWILKKDAHLFNDTERGLIEFVSRYVPERVKSLLTGPDTTLQYFDHDWTLNDLHQADEHL